jgi:hypothetical protein
MTKPSNSTKWVKGQSGNPGGRPKLPKELKTRIQTLGDRAIALEKALDNDDPRVVVMAAKELLDGGYGKPAQVVDTTMRSGSFEDQHLAALKDRMDARLLAKAATDDDGEVTSH